MLSHVLGAVDKTSSSFSAHGKIGNFIIIIIIIIVNRAAVLMFRLLQAIIINQIRLWSLRVNIRHNLLMVGLNITNMHVTLTPPRYHGTHDFLIQSRTLYYHDTPPPMVAAWECLSNGANVCVTVPANQNGSAIREFFRISDIVGVNWLLRSPPLPALLIPLLSTLPFHPPIVYPFSPPLKVGPLNPARRCGGAL